MSEDLKQLRVKAIWIWRKRILDRENSKCKCPEAGRCLVCPLKEQGGQYGWIKVSKEKSRKRYSQRGSGVRLCHEGLENRGSL